MQSISLFGLSGDSSLNLGFANFISAPLSIKFICPLNFCLFCDILGVFVLVFVSIVSMKKNFYFEGYLSTGNTFIKLPFRELSVDFNVFSGFYPIVFLNFLLEYGVLILGVWFIFLSNQLFPNFLLLSI